MYVGNNILALTTSPSFAKKSNIIAWGNRKADPYQLIEDTSLKTSDNWGVMVAGELDEVSSGVSSLGQCYRVARSSTY